MGCGLAPRSVIEERGSGSRRLAIWAAALVMLAAACTSPSETPSASDGSAEFDLDVVPATSTGRTIGGQRVVFLVTVTGSDAGGPVTLAADAAGATISVSPQPLPPGVVGEVTIVPAPAVEEERLVVTITASRGAIERRTERVLTMAPGEDSIGSEAAILLERFTEWLAVERPELGISSDTAWEGTTGSWVLVVNHYLYFSEDWELGLDWHVMIAPDDWARIYLRERWTQTRPSVAFEIPSVSGELPPREIDPPASVWR